SYLKMLYKYPQRAFPYASLVEENRRRGKGQPEFELIDTDAFAENRYFDVFVEYAKAASDDILMQATVCNHGPDAAEIHVLPQIWFRNTWSWEEQAAKPNLKAHDAKSVAIHHNSLDEYWFFVDDSPALLFCENETNTRRLFGYADGRKYPKDAFHEVVLNKN